MATRRVTNRQSDDSGPCRRCAAALSIAADAPTYILLGSHAKSGQPMRRSPRRAVPCGRRKWRFAVGHGRHQPRSLAERQHPSRSSHERLEPSGFAAESRPRIRRIPTAIRWQREESRIVNPMIPDLAVAARRLSASQRTHPHIYCSDRTPSPDNPCAARREGPSRADGENGASLSATDATNPAAWRRGSTHPDHRMRGSNRVLLRATIDSRTGGAYYDAARGPTECHASVHRVKPELASATRGSQRLRTFVPVGRARIARQTWGAHRWRIGMRVLRSTILNAAYVRLS